MIHTKEALILLALVVVPGYLGRMAFGAVVVRVRKTPAEVIYESLASSMLFYVLLGPLIFFVYDKGLHNPIRVGSVLLASAAILLAPPLLGLLFGALFKRFGRLGVALGMRPITPTSWDYRFEINEPLFVLVTFQDNTMMGGLWASKSFASSYPEEEDLYIQQVWRVEPVTGRFSEPVVNSAGAWIPVSSCKHLQFFVANQAQQPKRRG